ncbi:MAG: glutathione peroxidase [Rickettsiaceae bacterium]|nr:glutathione peroxidase [Rickettsiaceae bacterium]
MNVNDAISSEKKIEEIAYNFSFISLNENKKLSLGDFKGKVIVIVNTASKCGFTSQYADLEKIYQEYKDKGLVIIGVPSNNFGGQEPGSNEGIATFCQLNYGVTFPMTQKEKVSGEEAHPFYRWAKKTLGFGTAPKWNFHKYLINRKGKLIDYFHSTTSLQSDRFKAAIENALAEHNEKDHS